MINMRLLWAAVAMTLIVTRPLCAAELLTDGAFEFAIDVPGWDLEESIWDQTTMLPRDFGDTNSAEQRGFGPPFSGEVALFLRAFEGGSLMDPDAVTNASLSQTVPVQAGVEYAYSGQAKFEINYSGATETLNNGPLGPAGTPSPTETTMELAFLDGGGNVLQSTPLDLRPVQNEFTNWQEHVLTATAPAGTVSARVTANATAMLWNGGGQESAFYDDFSLVAVDTPETELLANADLEDELPPFNPAYEIIEVMGGELPDDATVSTGPFANRDDSGGQLGLWLRSFTGNEEEPADAIVSQTVAGMAGSDYTFSAWSSFQENYSGGDPAFGTQTLLEMAFLDGSGMEIGTPLTLDLVVDDEQMNGAGWLQHTINGTAPAGTVSVRVSAAGLGMEDNPLGGQQSAFLDDFSLDGPATAFLPGDYDGSGTVAAGDLSLVLSNWGQDGDPPPMGWVNDFPDGIISAGELSTVLSEWGNTAVFVVPEPASVMLLLLGAVLVLRRSCQ